MSTRSIATSRYSRIRLIDDEDFRRAYPLIAAYIENPTLASSVKEFFTDSQAWKSPWLYQRPGADNNHDPHEVISDDDHIAIKKYTESLGLGTETTQGMMDALDWWRSQIQPSPDALHEHPGGSAYYYSQQRLIGDYASTAAVLLLSLCPNIHTFYVGGSILPGPLTDYLLKSNYGQVPKPALQALEHVEHYGFEDPCHDDRIYDTVEFLDIFRYFHRLPQMTSISMAGVSNYQVERRLFPPKTSTGIKRIHLRYSDISNEMIATIVRIPTGLEELSLSYGYLTYIDGGCASIDLAFLGKCLYQHKATLQVLDLDLGSALAISLWEWEKDIMLEELEDEHRCDEYFHLDKAMSEGPLHPRELDDSRVDVGGKGIGSFREYVALTRLSISIRAILGELKFESVTLQDPPHTRLIDMLPPNLEYLCLYGYEKGKSPDMDSHIIELLEKKGERLPKLKEIVGVDVMERGISPEWLEREHEIIELGWVEV